MNGVDVDTGHFAPRFMTIISHEVEATPLSPTDEVGVVIDAKSKPPNDGLHRRRVAEGNPSSSDALPPVRSTSSKRSHVTLTDQHSKVPVVASILSGLVCGLIFYVFSAVFSAMVFDEAGANIPQYQSVGLAMNTLSAFVGGLIFARLSGCKAVMAGPDITPTVFMVEMAKQISSSLCPSGPAACDPQHRDSILPTVLVAIWISTAITGLVFLAIGHFRLTSVVGYMPANVTGGFLSCIGYKVMYYAIEVACGSKIKWFQDDGVYVGRVFGSWDPTYFHKSTKTWRGGWKLILPAFAIGLPLYYFKRKHIGKPTWNFPGMIIVPTAIFYCALFASGGDIDSARNDGWMFTKTDTALFWKQWEHMYGAFGTGRIAWEQLPSCLAVLAVMLPIVSLDNMLKLASSETALEMDLDYNKEIRVGGLATLVNSFFIATPCYGQTKFNVLNYGFTHTVESPLATVVMALFCGTLFFAGVPLMNYLPRLLLSGLLIFSAAGFLVENLVDARHKFNRYSFASIWIVWISNIIAGELVPQYSLLIAILAGVVLSAFGFAYTFARRSELSPPLSGEEHCSTAVRSAAQEMKLGVLGRWYHIFTARGFLFFGTASSLYRIFKAHTQESQLLPRCERTKMIIIDMTQVYGIDATTEAVFQKIKRLAAKRNIELVWAGLSPKVQEKFASRGVILGTHCFNSLDAAEKYVEDELLQHVHALSQQWLVDQTCRHIYNRAMLHDALTAHVVSDGSIGPSQLFKWAMKRSVAKGDVVFEEGDADDALYLLYLGKLELIAISPPSSVTVYPGAFFNDQVLYTGSSAGALYTAVAAEDSVMLRLDGAMRQEMQWHEPHTAYTLVLAVFRQAELRQPHRRHPSHAKPDFSQYSSPKVPLKRSVSGDLTDRSFRMRAFRGFSGEGSPKRRMSRSWLNFMGSSQQAGTDDILSSPPNLKKASTSSSTTINGTTSSSVAPSNTRNIIGARKKGMHGEAEKANSTYRSLLSQIQDLHLPHMPHMPSMPHMPHIPHIPSVRRDKKSFDGEEVSISEPKVRKEKSQKDMSSKSFNSTPDIEANKRGDDKVVTIEPSFVKSEQSVALQRLQEPDKLLEELSKMSRGMAAVDVEGDLDHGDFKVLNRHHDGRPQDDMRHESILDREFLLGDDFRVPLTPAQVDHYKLIFHLNDHDSNGSLQISELSRYMYSLGHGVPPEDLEEMLHEVGIDEDHDGGIDEGEFLEFIRRSLVANLPSSRLSRVNQLFERYVTLLHEASDLVDEQTYSEPECVRSESSMSRKRALSHNLEEESAQRVRMIRMSNLERAGEKDATLPRSSVFDLMHELGFKLDEHTFEELFEEVDSRGDGTVTRSELITALGMLKQNILEVMDLEAAFTRLRAGRKRGDAAPAPSADKRRSSSILKPNGTVKIMNPVKDKVFTGRFGKPESAEKTSGTLQPAAAQLDEHMVYASDLVLTLGVTEAEAEEMIFIADLQDNNAIDFTEFKQIVVNWS